MDASREVRGEYEAALEEQERQLVEAREREDLAATASAFGSLGDIHREFGAFDRALECYVRALETDTALLNPAHVSTWLNGTAETLLELAVESESMPDFVPQLVSTVRADSWRGDLMVDARRLASDALRYARQTGIDRLMRSSSILLARIEAAAGRVEAACGRLEEILGESVSVGDRAELHYWLWRFGRSTGEDEEYAERHRAEALSLYSSSSVRAEEMERKLRLEELSSPMGHAA